MKKHSFDFPDNEYYETLEKMTLPELEQEIKNLCTATGSDIDTEYEHEKIMACLRVRISKLNKIFECTPENIERLHRVANLIKDRTAMLYKKGNQLYEQMWRVWQANENEPFNDFYVELSLNISYNDEHSVLNLPEDGTGSNYLFMAEVLNSFYFENGVIENLIVCDTRNYYPDTPARKFQFSEVDGKIDEWSEGWFFEKFPKLKGLPITLEFHNLLFHSYYSLQDIIRINDVWSEVKVVWQHIGGQEI